MLDHELAGVAGDGPVQDADEGDVDVAGLQANEGQDEDGAADHAVQKPQCCSHLTLHSIY